VVDSAALPEDERRAIEALVEEAAFFTLPARLAAPKPDAFQYDVAIEREGSRHAVRVDEAAASEALRALVRRLLEVGREG
jgi:hypothetical protein